MSKINQSYVKATEVQKNYKVSTATLRRWDSEGIIKTLRTPGGNRLYNLNDVRSAFGDQDECKPVEKKKVCYARVSSVQQKNDLERQIQDLKKQYPDREVISDIGSGVNFKRKGLQTLLERIYSRDIEEIAIAHKDRLCRYGFELIEFICQKSGAKIVVLGQDEPSDGNRELADDLLTIVNYFVAKRNGLRSGANRKKRKLDATNNPENYQSQTVPYSGTEKKIKSMVRNSQMDL